MHRSILVLPIIPLAALPLWMGAPSAGAPLPLTVRTGEAAPQAAVAALLGPATAPVADARSELSAPTVHAAPEVAAPAPLEFARASRRLPTGMLLDATASEWAFTRHYAGLSIEALARQAYRIDQVVSATLTEAEDPSLAAGLRALSSETDALKHERAWLRDALREYTNPEDDGARVPAALAPERFVERNRDKDMEDLHVLKVQLRRDYNLLHRRAIDALFDEGSHTVIANGPLNL